MTYQPPPERAPNGERQRRPNLSLSRGLLPVGRFFGVPLYFAPSWILIAAIITFTYSGLVTEIVPDVSGGTATAVAFGYAVALAVCVLAHEIGHTAVSLLLRRPVRRVVIFLLGGVSEIEGELPRARDELLVSLAGPVVSLGLAAIAWAVVPATTTGGIGWLLLSLLAWSNLVVALFNLLPGLPLDGGRVLRAAVWGVSGSRLRGTVVAAWGGRVVAVAVGLAAVVLDRGAWSFASTFIGIALAFFIWLGATQSLRAAKVESRLPQMEIRRLLRPGLMVPWDLSVSEALRRTWEANVRGLLVVDSAGRPRALVEEARITAVPAQRRAWTPVNDVARPLQDGLVLPIDATGPDLVEAMRRTPAGEYLVVNPDGSPAGILSAADVGQVLTGAAGR